MTENDDGLVEGLARWMASKATYRFLEFDDLSYDGVMTISDCVVKVTAGDNEQVFSMTPSMSFEERLAICKLALALLVKIWGWGHRALDMITDIVSSDDVLFAEVQKLLVTVPIQTMYARAGRISEALDLAEVLAAKGIPILPELIAASAILDTGTRLYSEKYRRFLSNRLRADLPASYRASLLYNIANSLRSEGAHKDAIAFYNRAIKADGSYRSRPYLWREVAGCLFELGRMLYAQRFYKRAISLGESDPNVLALLGDTYLFSGDLKLAVEHLEQYQANVKAPNAHFLLKYVVANKLLQAFGERCERRTDESDELVSLAINGSEFEQRKLLLSALELDPLNGYAWFNYAVYVSTYGDRMDQHVPWLIAAVLQTWDLEAWTNAVCTAINGYDDYIVVAVCVEGIRIHGEPLLEGVRATLRRNPGFDESDINKIIDTMREVVQYGCHHFDHVDRVYVRYVFQGEKQPEN